MQPTGRQAQGTHASMSSMQPQIQGAAGLQQFDDAGVSCHDDFLDQVLCSLPWADINHGNPKCPWELPGTQKLEQTMREEELHYASPYDESFVASSLRQHQLSMGAEGKPMVLQQQQHMLLTAMGRTTAGADPGLLSLPMSSGGADSAESRLFVDRSRNDAEPTFKSPTSTVEDGFYNGFTQSLHGSEQVAAGIQHFQSIQGGAQPSSNFGASAAAGIGQTAAAASGAASAGTAPPKQRVRARRGQATDPHSIAERLRRERIADRMRALQELVPNANKTDKASMLDEIIDYVKFLQLQVKVLSMSRLGGSAAVAPLVADFPSEASDGGGVGKQASATAATAGGEETLDLAEHQVAKLMGEDMGAAMQYLQGKGLCLMPVSLASAISTTSSHSCPGTQPREEGGGTANQCNGDLGSGPHAPTANGDAPTPASASAPRVKSAMANGLASAKYFPKS